MYSGDPYVLTNGNGNPFFNRDERSATSALPTREWADEDLSGGTATVSVDLHDALVSAILEVTEEWEAEATRLRSAADALSMRVAEVLDVLFPDEGNV